MLGFSNGCSMETIDRKHWWSEFCRVRDEERASTAQGAQSWNVMEHGVS